MLHDGSPRAAGPFVELNCSAIPRQLVESELFGHERGAFSDARERKRGWSRSRTAGRCSSTRSAISARAAQAKLLTFLEQRTFRRVGATAVRRVDVRIVAATNRDLRGDGRGAALSRGPLLPVERDDGAPAAAARAAGGHPSAGGALPAGVGAEFGRRFGGVAAEAVGLLAATAGRETSASCGPSSAAPPSCTTTSTCGSPTCRPSWWRRPWPSRRSRRRDGGAPGAASRRWRRSSSRTSGACSNLRRQPHPGRPAPRHHPPDPRQAPRHHRNL